jgi:hypothetical protein
MGKFFLRVFPGDFSNCRTETFNPSKILIVERGYYPRVIQVTHDDKSIKILIFNPFHNQQNIEIDISDFLMMYFIVQEVNRKELVRPSTLEKIIKYSGRTLCFKILARNSVFEHKMFDDYEIKIIE